MKSKFNIPVLIVLLSQVMVASAQNLNYLDFRDAEEMYAFFKYAPDKKIISGHRGTMEEGMPENSIPAMEAVLKHTPAIFEVDPRLTKDSVAVMIHDNTLERTTDGTGRVADYTWQELQRLSLKNQQGQVTDFKINTLEEMIEWAKGKTILNLDKKDLPPELTASLIEKHDAYAWVWVTVHTVEQARVYLERNPKQYLSMHIRNQDDLAAFESSGLPYDRMIVYIGPEITSSNKRMYEHLSAKGVLCMISAAPTYDKLDTVEERARKYRAVFRDGAGILESDRPIEVSKAIGQVR